MKQSSIKSVMVSWIYNTANNAKTVFMHFFGVMLHGLLLCVHCQIDHYKNDLQLIEGSENCSFEIEMDNGGYVKCKQRSS
jgi:hypothetical protein